MPKPRTPHRQPRVNPLSARLQRTSLDAVGTTGAKASVETVQSPSPELDDPVAQLSPPPPSAERRDTYLPTATYSFRVRLPGRVAAKYASAAVSAVCDPEEMMESRLTQYADSTSAAPLTFTDEERREIIDALGTADPESILRHIRDLVTPHVETLDGVLVTTLRFTAQQLERILSRCAAGETLQSKLQEYADYGVNLQTGLA
jgi:hypothetical protein